MSGFEDLKNIIFKSTYPFTKTVTHHLISVTNDTAKVVYFACRMDDINQVTKIPYQLILMLYD